MAKKDKTLQKSWKKYAVEFLSIFVAVISAFALNNWNDNRRDVNAESKILLEILNGLAKDSVDINYNVGGHQQGIKSCIYWRNIFTNQSMDTTGLRSQYRLLTRDFLSIQNTSGFETLKSKGFELISNDSLRSKIISLYEFDYQLLFKLEEQYDELQFHSSYFHKINPFIAPHLIYDPSGEITGIQLPIQLNERDRQMLLSYLWKIEMNRKFILGTYQDVHSRVISLSTEIKEELAR